MNVTSRILKLFPILFSLLLAFFISGKFVPAVLAGCASGYYCAGTTVIDFPSGCQGPFGSGYCTQDYEYDEIDCNSDCSAYYYGVCCNSDCTTYNCNRTDTNCCAQDSATPTPTPGPGPTPTPTSTPTPTPSSSPTSIPTPVSTSGKTIIKAEVVVYWNDAQGYHEVKSATLFSDWRQR